MSAITETIPHTEALALLERSAQRFFRCASPHSKRSGKKQGAAGCVRQRSMRLCASRIVRSKSLGLASRGFDASMADLSRGGLSMVRWKLARCTIDQEVLAAHKAARAGAPFAVFVASAESCACSGAHECRAAR
jgi:hypothetical protein